MESVRLQGATRKFYKRGSLIVLSHSWSALTPFRLRYYIQKVLEICEKLTLLDIIFIIYLDLKYKSKYIRVHKKKSEE